ncbi:MAG: hypothetical protein IH940_10775 [Acidobacteria bacterium]|nr:hypothetical protein [Acidobacteriota bacterium]
MPDSSENPSNDTEASSVPPPPPPASGAQESVAPTPPPPAAAAPAQPPPSPAPEMPTAELSDGPADGHNIGLSHAALGMSAKRNGRVALGVLAAILEPAERVEVLSVGRYRGHNGVAALTDRSLIFVNDREWEPNVERLALAADLTVTGWQDERKAALVFESGGVREVIDSIGERETAQRLAEAVRSRVGA